MKTLQIGDDWLEEREGGLGRYYFELLRHLPATGTDYNGLVVGSKLVDRSTHGKVVAFASPTAPLPQRLWACRREGDKFAGIDLIAIHFALYGVPWISKFRFIPAVAHFHGPWAGESDVEGYVGLNTRFKSAVETLVYRRASLAIVLSNAFRRELVTRYGVKEDRVRVVPGGVDINRFHTDFSRREARDRLNWPQDRFILLSVRRQVRRMGLENLIEAARTLVVRYPEVLILLGGSGPLSGELQRRISEYGLDRNVRLLGRIEDKDLPTAYRAADLSVVPSQSLEGFGLITLESLASGTPVVVTNVGGLPEIVRPFAPQCVMETATSQEMAALLQDCVSGSRSLPSEEACRTYAVNGFSWSKVTQMVRSVYDEAMA